MNYIILCPLQPHEVNCRSTSYLTLKLINNSSCLNKWSRHKASANDSRTHCCGHIVAHDVSWAAQTGNKIRNILCVPTQNLCPQQMLRVRANWETFVSATVCPQQCVLVCQGRRVTVFRFLILMRMNFNDLITSLFVPSFSPQLMRYTIKHSRQY